MNNTLAAYYYALTGAIGGLAGWFVSSWVVDAQAGSSLFVRTLIKSLIVGAFIGAAICSRERSITTTWQRGVRDGVIGALAGAVAGAVSGIVGLKLFALLGQNLFGRLVGYVLLGTLIGVGEGLKWRGNTSRLLKGCLGGAVGGLIGAIFYDVTARYVSSTLGEALAGIFFGLMLGLAVSYAQVIGNLAVLRVIEAPKDKMLGQNLPLGKNGKWDILGSDFNNTLAMITDNTLAAQHCRIENKNREFYLIPLKGDVTRPGDVYLWQDTPQGGNWVQLKGSTMLNQGDKIKAGSCMFEFNFLADALVTRGRNDELTPETDAARQKAIYRTVGTGGSQP
jgi:hypothetical protein